MPHRGAAGLVGALVLASGTALAAPANPSEIELQEAVARLGAVRGQPQAVVPLLEVAGLDEDVPTGLVEGVLREVAGAADTDPLVAAHAFHRLSLLEDRRGDRATAARIRAALGLLSRFWVIGPFDGEGRAGHARVFPPETETSPPDRTKRYPGKEREVVWREAGDVERGGALHLDALLRPDTDAVGYAVTSVQSDVTRDAALRIGSPGPVKAWWNGKLVHERDVVRPAALDQDAAPVRVRKGWNRLVVKTLVADGSWRLFVRLTDAAGRGLPALVAGHTSGPHPVAPAPARSGRSVVVRDLGDILGRAARSATGGAEAGRAWLDLGRYLSVVHPGDRAAREAESALREAIARRPTVPALLALADVAHDEDGRRQALEQALAVAGNARTSQRALVLSRLGDVARTGRREALAIERWRAALDTDPGCWPAALGLASEEQAGGLVAVALARVDGLPERIRAVPRVLHHRVRLLEALGRRTEAEAELERLHAVWRDDLELLRQLASSARVRGDARGAIHLLRRGADLRPDIPSLSLELARALEGSGDAAQALAALEMASARIPDEPRLQAELGKLLHRLGRPREATERIRMSLALRPQNPELRRYLERLGVDGEKAAGQATPDDLARQYAADAGVIAAEAVRASGGSPGAGAEAALVLLDRRVVRVHPNGLSETFAQRIVEVRTDRGARENAEFYVRYTPGTEDVEVREARIFRRGGGGALEVLEASGRDDRDLSEPWYGLYYDHRAEVIRYEGLRPGDVLEVQYTVADVSSRNEMGDYFGDFQFIAEGIPKRRWDYTLLGPLATTFHFNAPRLPGIRKEVTEEGERRVHRFSASDVPKVDPEPAMPGYAEVAPYLHVSTYRSWLEVGARYWRLVEEQLHPDDSIRQAARSVTNGRMTVKQKVRALHGFVVSSTRYVGLEFGIHGYKPYKVGQILSRRFGDCKDKASLLVALLREVGVTAELVLVRTRRGGRVDAEPASLAIFDHAITYVPALDLYLDGTAEFTGTTELPGEDQGVMVLRVSPTGAMLTETPILPSSSNRAVRRWEIDLAATGAARVAEELTITGQAAPEWRQHYETPGERSERYGKVWAGRYPGASLVSLEMPGMEDRDMAVKVRSVADVPHLAEGGAEGRLELPATAREVDFARTYARLSSRRTDLVIAYPWQHEEDLIYRIPAGWQPGRLPSARRLETPFGRFELAVTWAAGKELRVASRLDVMRHRIAPADYGAFRRFLGEIDAALGERIVLKREAP